jgi:hypothetical protein
MIIKILAVGFALFALRNVIARYRKGSTLTIELLFWGLIFAGIGVVVFVPHTTDKLARFIGVSSGFNALVFLSIVGLLFAAYKIFMRVESLERSITRMVRAQALQSAESVAGSGPSAEPSAHDDETPLPEVMPGLRPQPAAESLQAARRALPSAS